MRVYIDVRSEIISDAAYIWMDYLSKLNENIEFITVFDDFLTNACLKYIRDIKWYSAIPVGLAELGGLTYDYVKFIPPHPVYNLDLEKVMTEKGMEKADIASEKEDYAKACKLILEDTKKYLIERSDAILSFGDKKNYPNDKMVLEINGGNRRFIYIGEEIEEEIFKKGVSLIL